MPVVTRRSAITTVAAILLSGCSSTPTEPTNQAVITNVSSVSGTQMDGTKSAHGYVKFTENADSNTVTIEQSIQVPGNPCQSAQMDVTPESGATNGDPIKVDVSMSGSGPDVACPSVTPPNYPEPSVITIGFESLFSEQTIIVSFNDVSVSYTTTGENNTVTREPFSVPEGVRVG